VRHDLLNQFSESNDDLVVIGGIPSLEGRIPMSDGAGARSRSSCHRQQRHSPTASCHSNPIGVIAGSGYIVRELALFPSRFAQIDPHPQMGPGVRIRFAPDKRGLDRIARGQNNRIELLATGQSYSTRPSRTQTY
jgi:hypothetical protein